MAKNVDRILWIHPGTRNVCMSGTSGAWNGILTLCPEDIQRLLEMAGVDGHGTE